MDLTMSPVLVPAAGTLLRQITAVTDREAEDLLGITTSEREAVMEGLPPAVRFVPAYQAVVIYGGINAWIDFEARRGSILAAFLQTVSTGQLHAIQQRRFRFPEAAVYKGDIRAQIVRYMLMVRAVAGDADRMQRIPDHVNNRLRELYAIMSSRPNTTVAVSAVDRNADEITAVTNSEAITEAAERMRPVRAVCEGLGVTDIPLAAIIRVQCEDSILFGKGKETP